MDLMKDIEKTSRELYDAYDRVRWGNSTEIQQDIDHFETFGRLPERRTGGF